MQLQLSWQEFLCIQFDKLDFTQMKTLYTQIKHKSLCETISSWEYQDANENEYHFTYL